MKKASILLLTIITFAKPFGQTLQPEVDKRVEVLSIIFRLAGNPEYNQDNATNYVAIIHSYFDKHKNDTIIELAKKMREENGVSFDGVMSMAVNLNLINEKFTLKNGWKQSIDNRWVAGNAIQFVNLLNNFYKKTEFEKFFEKEKSYYDIVTKAFQTVLLKFNQTWYHQYYGIQPKEKFTIVIGCGNGGANYGPSTTSPQEGKQIYAIMGSWSFDKDNNPIFKEEDYLPTLIHEFNHSFINPVLDKYQSNKILKNSAQKLLDTMKTEMTSQAYGDWQTLINESLVRAAVVRYLMANKETEQKIKDEIATQTNLGFLWTKELVELLGYYESNRTGYPTFKGFYPELINFFKSTADSISLIKGKYESNLPKIISIGPFSNNSQNVDTSIKEMIINFSHIMTGKGYSFNYGELGKDATPIKTIIGYSNDNKSFKIGMELKPDKEYEIIITGGSFKSIEGYPLKNYMIKFKTAK